MTDTSDLSGKIALVTGASRGIGRAFALELARAGVHVVALARTQGGLEELDDEIRAAGGTASLICGDITNREEMAALGPALFQRFERLDIYVANAAILGELAPVADISPKVWDTTIDVNLSAQWYLLAMLDPLLRQSDCPRVLFLSTGTVTGFHPFWSAYTASKAGLEALARTYANEMAKTKLRVSILNPGATRTDMRATAMPGEDPQSLPSAEEVARLMLPFATASYDGHAERVNIRDLM